MALLMAIDRDAIRQMMREGESKIEQHKSAVRTERRSKHELVDEFKKGAKGARTALSSRRKEDADGLRSKSGDLSELRSQSIIETVRANRLARDGVLEERSAPSQTLPPKEVAHVPLPLQYRPPSTARRSNRSASPKSKRSARKQLKSR